MGKTIEGETSLDPSRSSSSTILSRRASWRGLHGGCHSRRCLPYRPDPAFAQTKQPSDGFVLPFPPLRRRALQRRGCRIPSTSVASRESHLPKDAPNVLIILLDDVGFGLPDTYGGPIHTPTLSRIANQGISYNAFHTTAICSPTRAALLTGRNHQRVGSGTIAERAVDWDGYTGVIPRRPRPSPRCWAITDTRPRLSASGTIRPRPRPRRWGRSRSGRPARASASTTSTASWPARPRNGNRGWSRTSIRSSRPTMRSTI